MATAAEEVPALDSRLTRPNEQIPPCSNTIVNFDEDANIMGDTDENVDPNTTVSVSANTDSNSNSNTNANTNTNTNANTNVSVSANTNADTNANVASNTNDMNSSATPFTSPIAVNEVGIISSNNSEGISNSSLSY